MDSKHISRQSRQKKHSKSKKTSPNGSNYADKTLKSKSFKGFTPMDLVIRRAVYKDAHHDQFTNLPSQFSYLEISTDDFTGESAFKGFDSADIDYDTDLLDQSFLEGFDEYDLAKQDYDLDECHYNNYSPNVAYDSADDDHRLHQEIRRLNDNGAGSPPPDQERKQISVKRFHLFQRRVNAAFDSCKRDNCVALYWLMDYINDGIADIFRLDEAWMALSQMCEQNKLMITDKDHVYRI